MHQDLSFRLISRAASVAIWVLLCNVNIVVGDENIETREASQLESVADDRQSGQVMSDLCLQLKYWNS